MICTIAVYKFSKLSREEVEAMLGLSLEETRVYQEASAEGKIIGRQEGEQSGEARLVLRQLTRRIGDITPDIRSQIQSLSLTQLESLGEALLDFSQLDDLLEWLRLHS
jgi:predicted transposase YdaD